MFKHIYQTALHDPYPSNFKANRKIQHDRNPYNVVVVGLVKHVGFYFFHQLLPFYSM